MKHTPHSPPPAPTRAAPTRTAQVGADAVHRLLRCTYLSEYDAVAYNTIYGFSSEEAYIDALNCLGAEDVRVPFLALQPRCAPRSTLHAVCPACGGRGVLT